MKKLQAIVSVVIPGIIFLGIIFCLNRPSIVYGASAQNSAENRQPKSANVPAATGENETAKTSSSEQNSTEVHNPTKVAVGATLFLQNCSFCHGRDAGGGETGPDLTRSKLVSKDVAGSRIDEVVREGRPDKGMPPFNFSASDLTSIVDFIHEQRTKSLSQNGGRRGVEVADLQTGNVTAGKQYFNGAGGCAACHSPAGDLAGIASRYQGLELEERMLYPEDAKSTVTVTLLRGRTVTGTLAYLDEFTVGIRDASGTYRSWPVGSIRYSISSPADAHVALFSKYTDADIHNLMAYLQTLR
jgi:cytochrome c oxidase cbb3-type subunit 3